MVGASVIGEAMYQLMYCKIPLCNACMYVCTYVHVYNMFACKYLCVQ